MSLMGYEATVKYQQTEVWLRPQHLPKQPLGFSEIFLSAYLLPEKVY